MTARELIEQLEQCDPEMTVVYCNSAGSMFRLSEIISCEVGTTSLDEPFVILNLDVDTDFNLSDN